jgi:O-antigen/teichoic acid export membrane protein
MEHPPSLRKKAVHGVFWSALERLGPRAVQFIVSVVLARLLTPTEFGLIGMIMVFVALGNVFLNSGFGAALIQKQDATETHYSSVFYANILLSLVAAGGLWLAAPWIARFYDQPALIAPTRVLGLNFIFAAFGLIQTTLLTKRVNFKTQAQVRLIAVSGSGVVGVSMALLGYGIWSLVAQSLSNTLFDALLLWFFSRWRPRRTFSLQALRELFGFGSRMLASGVLDVLFRNIYNVVIGKLFLPADLGYYTRANSLQQIPSQTLGSVIGRVTFPLFSEIQEQPQRIRHGVRKSLRTVALVNFPLMIGMLVTARPLILTLIGEKWLASVPYLQLLTLVGLFFPLSSINLNVLLARGRSDLFFRLEVLKKSLIVVALLISWRWGIEAIILGQIVTAAMAYYLNAHYNRDLIDYTFWQQVRDLIPYLLAAGLMGLLVYPLSWIDLSAPALLLLQGTTGVLVYLLLCRALRFPEFMEGWGILRRRLQMHLPLSR